MVFYQPQIQPTMAQPIQILQQAQAQQLQSTSRQQQQPDFSEDISPARIRSTRLASVTTRGLQSLTSVSSLPVRRPCPSAPLSHDPHKLADTHTYSLRSSSSPIRTIASSSRAVVSSRSSTDRLPLPTIPAIPPADNAISPLVLDNAALDGQSLCACYACTPDSLVDFFDARYTPPDTALEYSSYAQSGTQLNCLGNSKFASSIPSDSYNTSYAQLLAPQNSVDSSSVQSIDNSLGHLPLQQQQQHLPLQNHGIGQISQDTSTLGLGLTQTLENSISAYVTNSRHTKPASLLDDTFVSQLVGFGNPKRNSRRRTQNKNLENPENPASSVDSSLPQTPAEASAPFALQFSDPVFDIMKYTKNSGEIDFDMLAASFLNDQVVAFDSLASAGTAGTGLSSNTSSTMNSQAAFDTSAFLNADFNLFGNDFIQQQQQQSAAKSSISPALPAASSLQNAFRSYAALPRMDASSSSSSSSAAASPRSFSVSPSSPNLASPVFDTALAFPYVGAANVGDAAANAWKDSSPAFSTMGTPALVADDTAAPSLMTSPMWGQLDLGSVSLFPQQTQQAEAPAPARPATVPRRQSSLQNEITLPTISPMELSMSAPQSKATSPVFNAQTRPALSTSVSAPVAPSSSSAPSSNKRTLESSVDVDDNVPKRARRAGSSVAPSARASTPASSHNGTRQGSAAPLSLDAPTQARTYYGPESKTSKRAVPAAAARKVAAIKAQAELVDDGELDVEGAIEMSIEAKRRQNTVAARRSRQRKAEHLQGLEDKIAALSERLETLENEKTVWMMRALAAGWTEASREATS